MTLRADPTANPPTREEAPRGPEEARDEGERQLLEVWAAPKGWRRWKEINNTEIGIYYIVTGLFFLLAGGVMALLMRAQLAVPNNDLIDADTYNQIFTMHGSTMMFLFAVPILEAVAVYLMPQFLGARDLPFPRMGAYAYWAYLFGGTLTLSSLFFGVAPDGGWFMYPPLTSERYSPGLGPDFWLLGLGFIEVSAIAAAVEIIVGVLKFRPPGMTLDRIPLFPWYMLVVAFMIAFGFPPLILGDILLELERAAHLPFFDPERGGDPLLWQHLFWLFGHPEVYIIFLPAAGIVSMIIPTFAGRPLVAYNWVVLAAIATGFISFGLWVHHMFTTGLPYISLSFFSAASMAVVVPSGIQVFAWIATLLYGKPRLRVPLLFVIGGIFIFVAGGLTGVMVASVPFDWQAHDSYFVVAHLHYVLIGGFVFPLIGGLYYWAPLLTGRMMSERLGRWAFFLTFGGFHLTFFPMHIAGLLGMPRRVYTYPEDLGWDELNLLSSIGAAVLAVGFAIFFFDLVTVARRGRKSSPNPWGAGTLEWMTTLPSIDYAFRSVPRVDSRYPLWDQPGLWREVDEGKWYLPGSPFLHRATLRTSVVEGEPQQVQLLPHPTWLPMITAFLTAAFFGTLVFSWYRVGLALGVATLACFLVWAWTTDRRPAADTIDAGRGLMLPTYAGGRSHHSWWGMLVVVLMDGTAYASLVFGYYFLWTASPVWPPPAFYETAGLALPGLGAMALVGSSLAMRWAVRANRSGETALRNWLLLAALFLFAAFAAVGVGYYMETEVSPTVHAYVAVVWTLMGYHVAHIAACVVMGIFLFARIWRGLLTPRTDQTLLNVALFWHFTTLMGLAGLAVVHLSPLVLQP